MALSGFLTGLYRPASSVAEIVLPLPNVSLGPVWTEKTAGITSSQIVAAVKRDLPSDSTLARILESFRSAAVSASAAVDQRVLPRGDEPGTEATGSGLPWVALAGLALAGGVAYLAFLSG